MAGDIDGDVLTFASGLSIRRFRRAPVATQFRAGSVETSSAGRRARATSRISSGIA